MQAHILIVEDDSNVRTALTRWLEHTGYQVTQAANGTEALDILQHESFDVVLTDMILGDIDGIAVLHSARQQPYRPEVILLTGHGTLESSIAALRGGAGEYLLKPCSTKELLDSVQRALQRRYTERVVRDAARTLLSALSDPGSVSPPDPPPSPPPSPQPPPAAEHDRQAMHVGALSIGHSRWEVTLEGTPLRLTPIEHGLLRFLAHSPGTVRSYSEIVHHTHNQEIDNTEAQTLLNSHVRNLRRKLGKPYIENDRGQGYRLIDPDAPAEHTPPDDTS